MTFNQHYRELGLQCRHSDGIPVQLGDEVHSMGSGTKRLLVAEGPLTAFFSYCREDSDFALRLAGDLKAAGASVWLDQLDIIPGQRWDRAVEDALAICPRMLVILSPISVDSTNVMDEVSFALEEKKTVIPVIYRDCAIPFRLRRVQYVDFRQDYARGLKELLKTLVPEQRIGQSKSAISDVPGQLLTDVAEPDSHECAAEGEPRKTVQDSKVAEQARVDQEPQQAAKREGFDQELKRTEQRHLPNKAQNATVRARLEEDRKPAAEQTQKDQEHEQAAASSPASKLLLGLATLGVALPEEDSSGESRRLGHISKEGSGLMRFFLVEAAQVTVRSDAEWRNKYFHLAMRRGRKVAKVAPISRSSVLDVAQAMGL